MTGNELLMFVGLLGMTGCILTKLYNIIVGASQEWGAQIVTFIAFFIFYLMVLIPAFGEPEFLTARVILYYGNFMIYLNGLLFAVEVFMHFKDVRALRMGDDAGR